MMHRLIIIIITRWADRVVYSQAVCHMPTSSKDSALFLPRPGEKNDPSGPTNGAPSNLRSEKRGHGEAWRKKNPGHRHPSKPKQSSPTGPQPYPKRGRAPEAKSRATQNSKRDPQLETKRKETKQKTNAKRKTEKSESATDKHW